MKPDVLLLFFPPGYQTQVPRGPDTDGGGRWGGSLQRRWQWAQTLVPSGVEAGGPPLRWEDVTEMGEILQFKPLSFKEIKEWYLAT